MEWATEAEQLFVCAPQRQQLILSLVHFAVLGESQLCGGGWVWAAIRNQFIPVSHSDVTWWGRRVSSFSFEIIQLQVMGETFKIVLQLLFFFKSQK